MHNVLQSIAPPLMCRRLYRTTPAIGPAGRQRRGDRPRSQPRKPVKVAVVEHVDAAALLKTADHWS